MRELTAAIDIDTPVERVWSVLADFGAYPEWNPFITQITGDLSPGSKLEVRIQPPGGRGMTLKPTVLRVEANRELAWLGHLLVPRLFDGEHQFRLAPLGPGRTRFTQHEAFRGILVPLTGGVLEKTLRGFEQMNAALESRAEQVG